MPECPDCFLFMSTQGEIDTHLLAAVADGGHGRSTLGGSSDPNTVVDKVGNSWSCSPVGLTVTTNYRGIIQNDVEVITANATDTTFVKFLMLKQRPSFANPDPTPGLYRFDYVENQSFYAEYPDGYVLHEFLAEFSVPALGTELTLVPQEEF